MVLKSYSFALCDFTGLLEPLIVFSCSCWHVDKRLLCFVSMVCHVLSGPFSAHLQHSLSACYEGFDVALLHFQTFCLPFNWNLSPMNFMNNTIFWVEHGANVFALCFYSTVIPDLPSFIAVHSTIPPPDLSSFV